MFRKEGQDHVSMHLQPISPCIELMLQVAFKEGNRDFMCVVRIGDFLNFEFSGIQKIFGLRVSKNKSFPMGRSLTIGYSLIGLELRVSN
jgi:hypothetical protein